MTSHLINIWWLVINDVVITLSEGIAVEYLLRCFNPCDQVSLTLDDLKKHGRYFFSSGDRKETLVSKEEISWHRNNFTLNLW